MKVKSEREVNQSCPTLCDPIDSSPPCSSAPRTLQARILKWVAISFSMGMLRGYQNKEKAGLKRQALSMLSFLN